MKNELTAVEESKALESFGSFTVNRGVEAPVVGKEVVKAELEEGDIVIIAKGPHAGLTAHVIENKGCIWVKIQSQEKYGLEVEIHEAWLSLPPAHTFYVGYNSGSQRIYLEAKNYKEAEIVAGNVSALYSRVTINKKKPKKDKTVYTFLDVPHYYEPDKFGKRW